MLDLPFIETHTTGFEALAEDYEQRLGTKSCAVPASSVHKSSGSRASISRRTSCIIVYGMGITQHRLGTQNVQQIANLLLMRGNFGRPGAGICPVRGHSNVQGDRTVGIDEKPEPELLDQIEKVFSFAPPQHSWARCRRRRRRR